MNYELAIFRVKTSYKIKFGFWYVYNALAVACQSMALLHLSETLKALIEENRSLALRIIELKRRNEILKKYFGSQRDY